MGIRSGVLALAFWLLLLLSPGGSLRAQDAAPVETDTAPIRLDGRELLRIAGVPPITARERAEVIEGRLEAFARSNAPTSSLNVAQGTLALELRAGTDLLLSITGADAALVGVAPELLAETTKRRLAGAIERYRAERTPAALTRSAAVAAAATVAFVVALFILGVLYRRTDAWLKRRSEQVAKDLEARTGQAMRASSALSAVHRLVILVRVVLVALLVLAWLDVVLSQFPWTRWLGDNLGNFVLGPVRTIGTGIVAYIPSLLFLIVLAILTRIGLRLVKAYFVAVERGTVEVSGFDRDWSSATYKIIRAVVLAVALVMAYPYLPGAGSQALEGVSVFIGLLLSLGASSAVANVIAGYITTFGRVFRKGDLIEVGGVRGVVTEVRLLTVRVRTIRNEEVTIPNSIIMGSSVTNFSSLSRDKGLMLQTEVGIGYEVPWRQVHAMLLEAAARTPDVMKSPAPFVVQRQLGDFAVVYQLNAWKQEADGLFVAYSHLHQNILDVFNEYGVQIMTPAYEGDTEQPKVVRKEDWYAAPARAAADASPPRTVGEPLPAGLPDAPD